MCKDPNSVNLTTKLKLLKVSFEFPAILQDLPMAIRNEKLYFLSVLQYVKAQNKQLQFDEEFGLYVQ